MPARQAAGRRLGQELHHNASRGALVRSQRPPRVLNPVVQRFGKIELVLDILINAAGILRPDPVRCHPDDSASARSSAPCWLTGSSGAPRREPLLGRLGRLAADDGPERLLALLHLRSVPRADFPRLVDVVLAVGFAPLLQAAALAKPSTAVVPRESPCVVNIGSLAGLHNSRTAGPVSYQVRRLRSYIFSVQRTIRARFVQVSKAAVIHLTKVLATRFLPLHVRVNALAPGFASSLPRSVCVF